MENKNNLEKILEFNREFVESRKKNSYSILYGYKID